jgi:multisubunit Na+/H+ antiporter MnhC subunit
LFNNRVILEAKSNKRHFSSSSPPCRYARINESSQNQAKNNTINKATNKGKTTPIPQARVLLTIIFSTSLLFLVALAQQRSQWKKRKKE